MSSPFGGPGNSTNNDQDYRSSLGYGQPPSTLSSNYEGTSQTSYGGPGYMTGRGSNRDSFSGNNSQAGYGTSTPAYDSDRSSQHGYGDGVDPTSKDYRFSPEEMRIIKECQRESTIYRSIPFAVVGSALTYLGIKNGYLLSHPKYGALPKIIGISIFGFIAGKISYFKECQEKFLHLPNSRVADALRRRREGKTGGFSSTWNQPLDLGSPKVYDAPNPAHQGPRSDASSGQSRSASEQSSAMNTDDYHNALDIDSEKNTYYDNTSLDESRPNSLDFDLDSKPGTGFLGSPSDSGSDRTNSYDDIRKSHRDAYYRPPQRPHPPQS